MHFAVSTCSKTLQILLLLLVVVVLSRLPFCLITKILEVCSYTHHLLQTFLFVRSSTTYCSSYLYVISDCTYKYVHMYVGTFYMQIPIDVSGLCGLY